MMKEERLLVVRHLTAESVNAVAGLTWGFPPPSSFLGFVHALSRKLLPKFGIELTGCGIVCHAHQPHVSEPHGWGGDCRFALTRNPLRKTGDSESIVEEGKMRMTVSLLIPVACDDVQQSETAMEGMIGQELCSMRIAGGTIVDIGKVELLVVPEDFEKEQDFVRKQMRHLLPGFALVQRSDLLAEHVRRCRENQSGAEPLDAWLDFAAIRHRAERLEGKDAEEVAWRHVPKPGSGWLVPLAVGYRGISKLHAPGQVARVRDAGVPFRFVEAAYGVGEWLSPHRIKDIESLIWRFECDPDAGWYLCRNDYRPEESTKNTY